MRFVLFAFFTILSALSIIRCIQGAPAAKEDKKRYSGKISQVDSRVSLKDTAQKAWSCDDSARLIQDGFRVGAEVTFLKKPSRSETTAYDVQLLDSPAIVSWVNTREAHGDETVYSVTLTDKAGRNWFCDQPEQLIRKGIRKGDHVTFQRRAGGYEQTATKVKITPVIIL
ncbi:hypothetical protein BJ165DRAFT_1400743 [Panaeolus papilionaceus]|nr:hypothetical protein BJ165DRAFT_1400743 [Panaeolus papilionaceus]